MRSSTNESFDQLLLRSWGEYDRVKSGGYVVQPAIPILFFGDSKRYFSSALKVVTVGLNPSYAEFPDSDRFRRFSNVGDTASDPGARASSRHIAALDSYFRCDPYGSWFASLEPLLNGMGCSFYDRQDSSALHTDLCSPIATRPTWTKLSNDVRASLLPQGAAIWHSLMNALEPDILLISVAERYMKQIDFRRAGPTRIVWRLDRRRPYEVSATPIEIHQARMSLLVFGRAAQKPFGTISNLKKKELGAAIKRHFLAVLQ